MIEKRLQIHTQNKESYEIVYTNSFEQLAEELEFLDIQNKKICIVTDDLVASFYLNDVKTTLLKKCKKLISYVFENGEPRKNLKTIEEIYQVLIENQFHRSDLLIALGGGVTGDLCGYAAATYLRGIDFVQIPTTLLSQVDSSIGGKTGVDFNNYKNMVGAFKMPRLVYMNLKTLDTLSDRQYYAGMGEVLKHGLIKDSKYYEWLLIHMYEIFDKDEEILYQMVLQSNMIKKAVVEKDPYELNERALLNFGHTIGHAIEKYKNFELLHGECVALGCVAASYISYQRGNIKKEDYYEIRDMFVPFNLPITIDSIKISDIMNIMKSDKKMTSEGIRFILLDKVGKASIYQDVKEQEIENAIQEIYFNEEENQ